MILEWSKVKVFVKPGPTDMRKQINRVFSQIIAKNYKRTVEVIFPEFGTAFSALFRVIQQGFSILTRMIDPKSVDDAST